MEDRKKIFDGLLVLEFQKGNRKALSQLVKRYHKDFCSYAHWYTRDETLAEDIVQDSWGIIAGKLYTLKNPNSFKSWAIRIITHKSKDQLNAQARKRNLVQNYQPLPETEQDAIAMKEERLSQLRQAIKELSFDQQMVLRLFYTEEQSLREISNILDISEGTVKSRLYHAREKLKSIINKNIS